jgi:hypothetical protein
MKATSILPFVFLAVGLFLGVVLSKLFDPTPWIENAAVHTKMGSPAEDNQFFKTFLRDQIYPNLPREGFLISGHGENDIYVGGNARVEEIAKFGENYLIIFKANNTFDEINKRLGPMYALVVYAAIDGTYKNIGTDLGAANFYIGYVNANESKVAVSVGGLDRVFVSFYVQSGGGARVCRQVEVIRKGAEVGFSPHVECPESAG